ncbi:MAG: thiamine-phosphate kinase [Parvibaculum sp.]|nr:thiamine-phosphate kinase [Parvibaculum sp.]
MRVEKPDAGERRDEFKIIEELFAPLAADAPGAYGLKDDAAVFTPTPGHETVLTVDTIVEGVHFLSGDPPASVARKLLRVNLSDLAAKGARPRGYLLAASWPHGTTHEWMRAFAAGLASDQRRYGISLWGGDTTSTSGALTLSLTAIGEVRAGQTIRRGGARPGDDVYVTGTIGDAALGLKLLLGEIEGLESAHADFLVKRYREPEPRVAFGPGLYGIASASVDVSDGLMADLGHICEVSGVGARIELARVPLSEAVRAVLGRQPDIVQTVVSGGDDYEILFTAAAAERDAIAAIVRETGISATQIGVVTGESGGVALIAPSGEPVPLKQLGYRHF